MFSVFERLICRPCRNRPINEAKINEKQPNFITEPEVLPRLNFEVPSQDHESFFDAISQESD